jgi:hypothetical protein
MPPELIGQPSRRRWSTKYWIKHRVRPLGGDVPAVTIPKGVRLRRRGDGYQIDVGRGATRVRVSASLDAAEIAAAIQAALHEERLRRSRSSATTVSNDAGWHRQSCPTTGAVSVPSASGTGGVHALIQAALCGSPRVHRARRHPLDWLSPGQACRKFLDSIEERVSAKEIEPRTRDRYASAIAHLHRFFSTFNHLAAYPRLGNLNGDVLRSLPRWLARRTGSTTPYVLTALRSLLRWAGYTANTHVLLRCRSHRVVGSRR